MLTLKERLFCYYFAKTQSARTAAAKAGFPERLAVKLLLREDIAEKIRDFEGTGKDEDLLAKARAGLERIAFGDIADPIRLLFAGEFDELGNLGAMDLTMVSEVRRVKGGGCEIKFADRVKALAMLTDMAYEGGRADESRPFYEALAKSAAALAASGVEVAVSEDSEAGDDEV